MQDNPTPGAPEPPDCHTARTIVVLTLPDKSRELLEAGDLSGALDPGIFANEEQVAMEEVSGFASQLQEPQSALLLIGLQHALIEEHAASVQFVELKSGYQLDGIGLEIKDDTVTEEKLFGPMRVMFVSWDAPSG